MNLAYRPNSLTTFFFYMRMESSYFCLSTNKHLCAFRHMPVIELYYFLMGLWSGSRTETVNKVLSQRPGTGKHQISTGISHYYYYYHNVIYSYFHHKTCNKYMVSENLHLTLWDYVEKLLVSTSIIRDLPGHKAHSPLWASERWSIWRHGGSSLW